MKNWIVYVCMFLSVLSVQAQTGKTTWGLKAGYTAANLWGNNLNDSLSTGGTPSISNGFSIGAGANSMIGKHFWLKHDLFLTQKGAALKINDEVNPIYTSKLKLLYLDIYPCSFAYHTNGFQVFLGPYLGMLLNATMQHKDSKGTMHTDNSIFGSASSMKHYTQHIDAGFVSGLEYEFSSGLNFGIRFVMGFVPLIENTLIQNGQSKIYNQNLTLSAGYTFGKKKQLTYYLR